MTDIPSDMAANKNYDGYVRFTVSMPQLEDDVTYRIDLTQRPAADNDTLSPCDYLIDWSIENRDNVKGFSAYTDGNHYRFTGDRIQEYHLSQDPAPFSCSDIKRGVQYTAQFANLLPAFMAKELDNVFTDPNYTLHFHTDTLIDGQRLTAIDAILRLDGFTAKETEYVIDSRSGLPVRLRIENNPGSISEQSIYVDYHQAPHSDIRSITEEMLINRYPNEFELFRQSNFRIENLPGRNLPGITLPTITRERYSRRAGDTFRTPTIVAIIDAETAFTPRIIDTLRSVTDRLPYQADIIWAFTDKHADTIENVVGPPRQGEHILMNAGALARDCGLATPPAVIIANTDGTVADIIIGYNKNLYYDVIQKMSLIKP